MSDNIAQLDPAAIKVVTSLVPAIGLFLVDMWLRRRGVRDPTAIWLYTGLLTWTLRAVCENQSWPPARQLAASVFGPGAPAHYRDTVAYFFSPFTTIAFTVAAFRLSRVRDLVREHGLQVYRNVCIIGIVALSVVAWGLVLSDLSFETGKYLDATASIVAVLCLAVGLGYSFYQYGHPLLVVATLFTFIALLWRQISGALLSVTSTNPLLAARSVSE